MKTYYIVEERSEGTYTSDGPVTDYLTWRAYYGLFARLGWWRSADAAGAYSNISADDCEKKLRRELYLAANRYRVVRVVKA